MDPSDRAKALAYHEGTTVQVTLRDPVAGEQQYNGRIGTIDTF
jgi:ribosome maturation factor RimP